MLEIRENQEVEINSLLSFRGKIRKNELETVAQDMGNELRIAGATQIGKPITATFGVEGEYVDVEILLPIDKKIANNNKYQYKDKIKIVNAIVASYKGNPSGVHKACSDVNQYIMDNQLQPITVGYNMTKYMDSTNIENTEIDICIGINPNIL